MCACACTCYVHCNYASMHVCMYVGVGGQMGCGRGGGGGLLGGCVCVCGGSAGMADPDRVVSGSMDGLPCTGQQPVDMAVWWNCCWPGELTLVPRTRYV